MATDRLVALVAAVRAIESVETIRLATRVPVTMPQRITRELVRALRPLPPALGHDPLQPPEGAHPGEPRRLRAPRRRGLPGDEPDASSSPASTTTRRRSKPSSAASFARASARTTSSRPIPCAARPTSGRRSRAGSRSWRRSRAASPASRSRSSFATRRAAAGRSRSSRTTSSRASRAPARADADAPAHLPRRSRDLRRPAGCRSSWRRVASSFSCDRSVDTWEELSGSLWIGFGCASKRRPANIQGGIRLTVRPSRSARASNRALSLAFAGIVALSPRASVAQPAAPPRSGGRSGHPRPRPRRTRRSAKTYLAAGTRRPRRRTGRSRSPSTRRR